MFIICFHFLFCSKKAPILNFLCYLVSHPSTVLIFIVFLYRPPSSNASLLDSSDSSTFCTFYPSVFTNFCIIGNFNANYLLPSTSSSNKLSCIMSSFSLSQNCIWAHANCEQHIHSHQPCIYFFTQNGSALWDYSTTSQFGSPRYPSPPIYQTMQECPKTTNQENMVIQSSQLWPSCRVVGIDWRENLLSNSDPSLYWSTWKHKSWIFLSRILQLTPRNLEVFLGLIMK